MRIGSNDVYVRERSFFVDRYASISFRRKALDCPFTFVATVLEVAVTNAVANWQITRFASFIIFYLFHQGQFPSSFISSMRRSAQSFSSNSSGSSSPKGSSRSQLIAIRAALSVGPQPSHQVRLRLAFVKLTIRPRSPGRDLF